MGPRQDPETRPTLSSPRRDIGTARPYLGPIHGRVRDACIVAYDDLRVTDGRPFPRIVPLVEERAVVRLQDAHPKPSPQVASRQIAVVAVAGALWIRVQHADLSELKHQLVPHVRVEVVARERRRLPVGVREEHDDLGLKKKLCIDTRDLA